MSANVVQDRLGDLFVREGLITEAQLQEALRESQQSRTRIGFALVKLGFVQENQLTRALAKQFRVPAVDLDKVKVEDRILRLVPEEVAMKHRVLPLRKVGRTLTVAMANPTDMGAIDNLKFITRYEIEPVIVGDYTLQKHLEDYYGLGETKMQEMLGDLLDEEVEILEDTDDDISVAALEAEVDKAPVVKFINGLLTDAVLKGVSDIHIEPYEREIRIRYRIDGSLLEVMKPPFKMKAALTSRIKILADLNIAERRKDRPQNPGPGESYLRPGGVRIRAPGRKGFHDGHRQSLWNGSGHGAHRIGKNNYALFRPLPGEWRGREYHDG